MNSVASSQATQNTRARPYSVIYHQVVSYLYLNHSKCQSPIPRIRYIKSNEQKQTVYVRMLKSASVIGWKLQRGDSGRTESISANDQEYDQGAT